MEGLGKKRKWMGYGEGVVGKEATDNNTEYEGVP